MSAIILKFPPRLPSVRVEAEIDGLGYVVLTPCGYGSLHGSFPAALAEAREIAVGLGASVRSSADWSAR
jgi:hypothetical protein